MVSAPLPLLVLEVVFILWVFVFLFLAVGQQLSGVGNLPLAAGPNALFGVFGGALPIFAAYLLSTNRELSRIVSLAGVAGIVGCALSFLGWAQYQGALRLVVGVLGVGILIGTGLYLYRSDGAQVYYLTLQGKPLPENLQEFSSKDNDPDRAERFSWLRRWDVMSFLEHLVILAVAALFTGALLWIS